MSDLVASTTPKLRVLRIGQDPIEVQTSNPDLVRWDLTRARKKWPSFEDGPFLWMTFLAWSAARRLNVVGPETTFEVWQGQVTGVDPVDEEDDFTAAPDPTRSPAPDPQPEPVSN